MKSTDFAKDIPIVEPTESSEPVIESNFPPIRIVESETLTEPVAPPPKRFQFIRKIASSIKRIFKRQPNTDESEQIADISAAEPVLSPVEAPKQAVSSPVVVTPPEKPVSPSPVVSKVKLETPASSTEESSSSTSNFDKLFGFLKSDASVNELAKEKPSAPPSVARAFFPSAPAITTSEMKVDATVVKPLPVPAPAPAPIPVAVVVPISKPVIASAPVVVNPVENSPQIQQSPGFGILSFLQPSPTFRGVEVPQVKTRIMPKVAKAEAAAPVTLVTNKKVDEKFTPAFASKTTSPVPVSTPSTGGWFGFLNPSSPEVDSKPVPAKVFHFQIFYVRICTNLDAILGCSCPNCQITSKVDSIRFW